MTLFTEKLQKHGLRLKRGALETLQINLGKKCNQACRHCHVDAAPWRTEMMDAAIAGRIADWMGQHRPAVVDITGGAPELNPNFRFLAARARGVGARVIDRNNLTILDEPGFEWLAEFLAAQQIEVIASLPCYLEENVNRQRGNRVFEKSIRGLRALNALGYGRELPLDLVYNPLGPTLPPPQRDLEADYREVLERDHGVVFHRLFTLTNQPIARFAEDLRARGQFEEYMTLLAASFNPATVPGLMCRTTLSIGHDGVVHDCDFNQMLGMRRERGSQPLYLWDIAPDDLDGAEILTAEHCLACTAGCGSSCTGALAA